MYNVIEYSSNYSETTRILWCYSKGEVKHFNADDAKTDNLKSFKYKIKILENTQAQRAPNKANGILEIAMIAVPLKFLNNSRGSLEISLINCKVELNLIYQNNYCVLFATVNDKVNHNDDNGKKGIFTIKDTKFYVPLVTLSARDNHKLLKFLSKRFEKSVYWNE